MREIIFVTEIYRFRMIVKKKMVNDKVIDDWGHDKGIYDFENVSSLW